MVWDCHSDLLWRLLDEPIEGFAAGRQGEHKHYDIQRMRQGGVRALVLALFVEDDRGEHPVVRVLRMIDTAERLVEKSADALAIARSAADVERAIAAGKTAAVLSIENGAACLDRLELLRTFYRLGVRAMGLVWNGRNAIADGCGEEAAGGKLTSFGRSVVDEMVRLGMIVDVSHLSVAGFWDVAERTAGRPFVASHSNARALCDHRRNLEDAQCAAIGKAGGVVGVNFYPGFVREGGAGATLDDVVRHVEALAERTGGVDHVGIGADFDGITSEPAGLEDPSCFPALAEALSKRGFGAADVEKVMFGNFFRVFKAVCG